MSKLLVPFTQKLKDINLPITSKKALIKKTRKKASFYVLIEIFFLILILFSLLISVSLIIDQVSINKLGLTANEFLYGKRLNPIDSFLQTIEFSFIGNAPSYNFQPFLTYQLLDNYANTLILLTLSYTLSWIIALFYVMIWKHTKTRRLLEFTKFISNFNMIIPGVLFLILATTMSGSLIGQTMLSVDINVLSDWILPTFILSLPLSTFIAKRIWNLNLNWRKSQDRMLVFPFLNTLKRRILFFRKYISEFIILFLVSIMIQFVVTAPFEYMIAFPGVGSFFVNSLINEDLWAIEPIMCNFIYIAFVITIFINIPRWLKKSKFLWRKKINE